MHITHRLFAAALIAMSGASVMVAIARTFDLDPTLAIAATFGAFIAGGIGAPLFGQPGRHGALMAAFGAVITTVLGAALAGFGAGLLIAAQTANPLTALSAALIAPVFVFGTILTSPSVLLVWLVTMSGAHLVMWHLRGTPDWAD